MDIYATATQRHLLVTLFQINPTMSMALATVVVGSATVLASKLAPHVIARPVPLSVIRTTRVCPSAGLPVRFVVIDVIVCASAVIDATPFLQLSVLIAGVADCVTASTTELDGMLGVR